MKYLMFTYILLIPVLAFSQANNMVLEKSWFLLEKNDSTLIFGLDVFDNKNYECWKFLNNGKIEINKTFTGKGVYQKRNYSFKNAEDSLVQVKDSIFKAGFVGSISDNSFSFNVVDKYLIINNSQQEEVFTIYYTADSLVLNKNILVSDHYIFNKNGDYISAIVVPNLINSLQIEYFFYRKPDKLLIINSSGQEILNTGMKRTKKNGIKTTLDISKSNSRILFIKIISSKKQSKWKINIE